MTEKPAITIKITSANEKEVTYTYCVGDECTGGIIRVGESIEIYTHEIKDKIK